MCPPAPAPCAPRAEHPQLLPPLGLDSPAAGPAEAERGCCPLLPAEGPGAPEPQGLLLSMAGAAGAAPGGLCSINGRPGRAAALGGGERRALAEPAGAQAHGPRGRPAGAAQRGLGLLHGDIFSLLRSNRGRPREAGPGLRGSGRGREKSCSRSPAGPGAAAARGVGTTHRLLGAAPAPARPPLPRNGDESPAAVAGPGCSRAGRARGHDGICSPGPRGACRELRAPSPGPGPAQQSPRGAQSAGVRSLTPLQSK